MPEQPLRSEFTFRNPPPFREIPQWWQISQEERDAYYAEERLFKPPPPEPEVEEGEEET